MAPTLLLQLDSNVPISAKLYEYSWWFQGGRLHRDSILQQLGVATRTEAFITMEDEEKPGVFHPVAFDSRGFSFERFRSSLKARRIRVDAGAEGTRGGEAGGGQDVQPAWVADLKQELKATVKRSMQREVATLVFKPTASSRPASLVYRPPCMAAYIGPDWQQLKELRCLVTGLTFEAGKVVAAHVFQHDWRPGKKALAKAGVDIDGPQNVIPCYDKVEKNLDRLRITIEPTSPGTFTVRVLDPSLLMRGEWVVNTDAHKLLYKELDGRVIDFAGAASSSQHPPLSALVCAIHMQGALAEATNNGWETEKRYKVPKWARKLACLASGTLAEAFLIDSAKHSQANSKGVSTESNVDESQQGDNEEGSQLVIASDGNELTAEQQALHNQTAHEAQVAL